MGEIIDFHIHPFYGKENNICFYEGTIKDTEQLISDLKQAGVTHCCGSVIRRMEPKGFEEIRALNDEALTLRDMLQGFYTPGIHIHPGFPRESIEELEWMNSEGVELVGELVPYMMGWDSYYSKNLDEIYGVINELKMTVSLHTIYEDSIDEALSRFPDITFVAAHPGDKEQFLRHIERMEEFPNYYLDLSGTGIFRYGLIKYGVNAVGSERFIFGTDYPICNPAMYISAVQFEKLKPKDYDNIFYLNAKRILNL